MSRSTRTQPPAPAAGRQNEYFVPRDGIDREVISADICRYLGNDALVRPGHYENPQTGQVVQGYYITAYRNLTTAMIEDLKADSARWDSERRAQTSRNTPGGIHTSRDASGVPARHSSNSPAVQYRYSETHQSRQHHGPTAEPPYQSDPYARDSYDSLRYPGTGAPGYTGASGSYTSQAGYPSSGGAFANYAQQSPPADPRYAAAGSSASGINQGYQPGPEYVATGSNLPPRGGYSTNDPYGNTRAASGAAQHAAYASGSSQPAYPPTTSPYQYSSQAIPVSGASYPAMQQPQDPFYGRAGQPTAQQQGYPTSQGQQQQQQQQQQPPQPQQYAEAPRARASATPTNAQNNPSGTSAPNARRSDRESDRHSSDRSHRPPRR